MPILGLIRRYFVLFVLIRLFKHLSLMTECLWNKPSNGSLEHVADGYDIQVHPFEMDCLPQKEQLFPMMYLHFHLPHLPSRQNLAQTEVSGHFVIGSSGAPKVAACDKHMIKRTPGLYNFARTLAFGLVLTQKHSQKPQDLSYSL